MQTLILTKQIPTKFPIEGIALVNLEDEIDYQSDKDGIHATGIIHLSGEYYKGVKTSRFAEDVEVDVFAPTEQIINRSELNLRIVDFDYKINENEIIFKIKVEIMGLKELTKTFLTPDVFPVDMEKEEMKLDDSFDFSKSIPAGIDLPFSGPPMNDSSNRDISIKEEQKIEQTTSDSLKQDLDTIYNSSRNEPSCEPIKQEDISASIEVKPDVIRYNGVIEENETAENPSFLRNLLPRKQQVVWSFRVVLKDDTYESIANELHINCDELKMKNHNVEVKEGMLLAVPRK